MSYLALIDYGSGNLHSAERALRAARAIDGSGLEVLVTDDPGIVRRSDRIVLPGVGHFADCAASLKACDGMIEALQDAVVHRGIPFLGICVGMQLMATQSREDGVTPGLGWIDGDVARIEPGPGLKVPHMGWNSLMLDTDHPVLSGLGVDPHVYFTHSYSFRPESRTDVAATSDYGHPIVAAVARDNLFGTQFHPEKSQRTGQKLLSNFLSWRPA